MMTVALVCLLVIASVNNIHGVIVANEDNSNSVTFVISYIEAFCGDGKGGPVKIVYNSGTTAPNAVKMFDPVGKSSCAVTKEQSVDGVYTLDDVRNKCDILQPDPTKEDYYLQIVLQEVDGVVLSTDPKFNIKCEYKTGQVKASSSITTTNNVPGTSVVVEATGEPDMTYSLNVLDSTQQPLTTAALGDQIVLQVAMSGTDSDEVSLRVESCVAKSGGVNVTFLESSCMAAGKSGLSNLPGFQTSGTTAFLPLSVFAVEGSTLSDVEYECVINVCDTVCDGLNCQPTGRRRRQVSDNDGSGAADKSLKLARTITVVQVPATFSRSTSEAGFTSESCIQSLGFIVTVTILAVLLLIAMATIFFMFSTRRRDLQKQTP